MNAFLFPGQGSQEIGMGSDLFALHPTFRDWIRRASDQTGADLERICLRGPDRVLRRPQYLQPLVVAVSLGYLALLRQRGVRPQVVLGHSLGEITALAAAGVLAETWAVEAAVRRGALMASLAADLDGGMLAVTAPDRAAALDTLADLFRAQRIYVANDNSPTQCVLSGPRRALAEAARLLSARRTANCGLLPVDGPWHSPLMAEAARQFGEWLQAVPFDPPRIPVLMNGWLVSKADAGQARVRLARHVAEPVLWRANLELLKTHQPRTLMEVGPGRVLSGLARGNGFGNEVRVVPVNNRRGVALAAGD